MNRIIILVVVFFSMQGFASTTSKVALGKSSVVSGPGVLGYSKILKISGDVSSKDANCEKIVADAVERFGNTAELSSTMTFDYLYACLFGSFVVQVLIEPRSERDIPVFLKYMEQRDSGYFYKQPVKFLSVASLEVDTRIVARHYVTRKKIDFRYDFTSSREFVFENFAQYFAMKEGERQVFWMGEHAEFIAHLKNVVDPRERELVPEVVKQSNYFTQQFPLTYVLEGGQAISGFWTDGVFRDERKFGARVEALEFGERRIMSEVF